MSDNQVPKNREEFLQKLEAGLGGCKWEINSEKDASWYGYRENKSARFKVFADEDGARWEFIAFFSQDKSKSDFREKLKKVGWENLDNIKWDGENGQLNVVISRNIEGKRYNFTTGISGTGEDSEYKGYFVIKPQIGKATQNRTVEYAKLIDVFNTFSKNIKDSGIAQIFDDFFGEEDEKKSGRAKKSNNQNNNNRPTVSSPSESRQIIYFGAPGTSKSYTLNEDAKKIVNQERVTFYPGYSYQQFVGTYKPFMDGDKISYKFVPGPLLRLLEKALKAEKAEKAKPQDENKEDTPAAEASTENPENGKEEKDTEKFLLIVEELNRAEAAAVFGDLFQLLDRNSDGSSEYPISVSEDLKQYLRRETDKTDEKDRGVWADVPEDEQKKLYFPSNFYIWATMNSADQGVFPLDTAFKRRWDFKYFGIDDAKDKLTNDKQKFWNNLRTTINDALQEKLNLNEDKLLGPFFMKVEENIDEPTFWERFCSKVLLYLYEDAARLNRNRIFQDKITYSRMFAKFAKFCEEKGQGDLKKVWNEVFRDVKLDDKLEYPWPKAKAETEEGTSSAPKTDDNKTAEPVTENNDETNDEQ